MGLDMYLNGKKQNMDFHNSPMDDGYPVTSITVELGYWRKHPNLHGFIVQNFAANGEDNCEPIDLTVENIDLIIEAIKSKNLPHTEGFFFGQSSPEDDEPSLKIFKQAKEWLNQGDNWDYRTVYYRASW